MVRITPPMSASNGSGETSRRQGAQGSDIPPQILVIDDNPSVLDTYRKILRVDDEVSTVTLDALEASLLGADVTHGPSQPSFLVDLVQDGQEGCHKALQAFNNGRPYAVAFVDMRMPGGWDGLETIEQLWRVDPDLQVVICTAYTDYSWDEIVARLGRSDRLLILRKPFERIEVLQLACALSDKWRLSRERAAQLGELESRVEERTRHLRQALSERKAYETQLHHQATHDALTGLPNRILFMDRLRQAIAYAKRRNGQFVVSVIDLDHFKWVNDSLGHERGDELLKAASQRMSACLRETDTVARIGGDEFVCLVSDTGDAEAMRLVEHLADCVSQPVLLGDQEVAVTCSVGCSNYPEDGDDADALLRFADAAMYRAKEMGRYNVQIYNTELRARIDERVQIEAELRHAIEREELALRYQPQIDLRSGRILGVEALLRWRHPELGDVAPSRFIPIAEETGLIEPITEWVLHHACAQNKAWQQAGLAPVRVAVNLSAKLLNRPGLEPLVVQCLSATGLDPAYLELELTESATMEDPDKIIPLMQRLRELGVGLSVDDFGTGYSNMHYLKRFPVDEVKLDGSFVTEITTDPGSLAIVDAIIAMAHRLGLKVVAEMTVTEGQVVQLATLGCDQAQGYYFSPPVAADECAQLLRAGDVSVPEAIGSARDVQTVLVLNDDPSITSVIEHELRFEGYRLLYAGHVGEAFELLARHKVGVIVCYQQLRESSGVEFLGKVKRMYPNTVRLICSGQSDFEAATAAINRGAVHKFLTKPWHNGQLRTILSDAFKLYERSLCAMSPPAAAA